MIIYEYDNIKITKSNLIDNFNTYIISVNNEMAYEFNCKNEIEEFMLVDVAKDFKSIVKVKNNILLYGMLKNNLDKKLQDIINESETL